MFLPSQYWDIVRCCVLGQGSLQMRSGENEYLVRQGWQCDGNAPKVNAVIHVTVTTAGWHMLIGFLYKAGNSLKSWKQQSQHTRPIVHARTLNIGAIQNHYSIV